MPIIASAKKKMRQDKKREAHNEQIEKNLKRLIKNMRKSPSFSVFQKVTSALDKAAKSKIFSKNKAARLKSRLSKLLNKPKVESKTIKKSPLKAIKNNR